MAAKKDVFCKEYNEVAFVCNETDRYEIPAETSICVFYRTLIDEFRKFSLKVMILPQKPPFLGLCDRSPSYTPTGHGLRFWTSLNLPSIRRRANGDRTPNRLFVPLAVSAVDVPKFSQISTSQR